MHLNHKPGEVMQVDWAGDTAAAVSYTHLDVYKRQQRAVVGLQRLDRFVDGVRRQGAHADERRGKALQLCVERKAVSYTHLSGRP